jgi:hypothetical protein
MVYFVLAGPSFWLTGNFGKFQWRQPFNALKI